MPLDATKLRESEAVLRGIIGARLTSVQFVLNYLILGFDNKGAITALVWPEICDDATILRFGNAGYRDRLCGLIEKVVQDVQFTEDETIIITLSDTLIRIPLQSCKHPGERAIFTYPKHGLCVW